MKIKKYQRGGFNGDPLKALVAASESTRTQTPDAAMLDRVLQAEEASVLSDLERQRMREEPLGMYYEDAAGLEQVNPVFEILSFAGPKLFQSIGKKGIKMISDYMAGMSAKELSEKKAKDIVMEALDPMKELAERRANENLQYVAERAIKKAGSDDTQAFLNLQNRAAEIADEAMGAEMFNLAKFENEVDRIFGQARIDDLVSKRIGPIQDVGDAADVARIAKLDDVELGLEKAKLFEDLGLTTDEAMQLLEERFMVDPDAMKLDLTTYGRKNLVGQPGQRFVYSPRINKDGGLIVPMRPVTSKSSSMRPRKR